MSDRSAIEWTDATWNPLRARAAPVDGVKDGIGWYCEHVSDGCANCYAESINRRLGTGLPFKPGHRAHVEIFLENKTLLAPLRWKRPRMIFVCSMSDLFGNWVKDEWIDKIFAVMALCPQHTFQVLTKRAERMRDYVGTRAGDYEIVINEWANRISEPPDNDYAANRPWPLPNVWLGVSAERQQEADERIPQLLDTPAAVRFVSLEPLLGPIDARFYLSERTGCANCGDGQGGRCCDEPLRVTEPALDWVIVGGESGPKARPMHPQWARDIRDQCQAAGVAFFFKQWGGWVPDYGPAKDGTDPIFKGYGPCAAWTGDSWRVEENGFVMPLDAGSDHDWMYRVGKKAAGRLLDGREWNELPQRLGTSSAPESSLSHQTNDSTRP